jgi:hypothetical protein
VFDSRQAITYRLYQSMLAPAFHRDSSVWSDLNIVMTGSAVAYDSLVFLHRFGPQSAIYTICHPGQFMVFIDPAFPELPPESMGQNWIVLCQDEVYVRRRVPVESLIGVIVHPADAGPVMTDCVADLRRLCIPLHDSEMATCFGNLALKERASFSNVNNKRPCPFVFSPGGERRRRPLPLRCTPRNPLARRLAGLDRARRRW